MSVKASLFVAASLISLGFAGVADAQAVRIEDAVARVVYMPEDRADVAVEINQGSSALPQLRVRRSGNEVTISGGVGGRRGPRVTNCNRGNTDGAPATPGLGAAVTVAGLGRITLDDAPLIVVRGPRNVDIRSGVGVYGTVGTGAESVKVSTGGCGDWVVPNVEDEVRVRIGGSGRVWVGRSGSLDVAIGGSGDVFANPTGAVDVSIGGSGNVVVQSAQGAIDVNIGGSGDVRILDGNSPQMDVAIAGSGDVEFRGTVVDLNSTLAGSGNVRVHRVTGNASRRVFGSGRVTIEN